MTAQALATGSKDLVLSVACPPSTSLDDVWPHMVEAAWRQGQTGTIDHLRDRLGNPDWTHPWRRQTDTAKADFGNRLSALHTDPRRMWFAETGEGDQFGEVPEGTPDAVPVLAVTIPE